MRGFITHILELTTSKQAIGSICSFNALNSTFPSCYEPLSQNEASSGLEKKLEFKLVHLGK